MFCRQDRQGYWVDRISWEIKLNPNFSPSTRIEDAWEVVEKLKNNGSEIAIYTDANSTECRIIDAPNSLMTVWGAEADTPQLAICLCALKACGIEVQDDE